MLIYLALLDLDCDKALFSKLHTAYKKKLLGVARSILKSQALSEDAIQNSWMNVIRSFESVKALPWEETEGYLVTVVKNAANDLIKKEHTTEPIPENWEVPDPEAGAAIGYQALVDLIRSMPEQYREILELKFVLEWSNKDIAEHLHMNESTVSSRIERGRELLKKILREEGICYE